jgi:AcrR family transcriptional regulator
MGAKIRVTQLHPTKLAILDVAMAELDRRGQGGFRVARVIEESNSSYSSLYHHFGSREDLIREAYAARFVRTTRDSVPLIVGLIDNVETSSQLFDVLASFISLNVNDAKMKIERRHRIEVLGFAMTDPDLMIRIGTSQREALEAMVSSLRGAQRRGLICKDLDVGTYVVWLVGMQLGSVLAEIDPLVGDDLSAWNKCATLAFLQPLVCDGSPICWSSSWEWKGPAHERAQPTSIALATADDLSDVRGEVSHPTKRALLERTKHLLVTGGEESLRLPMILEGIDTSVTSIYHFFGSRESLIEAASAELFVSESQQLLDAFELAMNYTHSFDEFFLFMEIVIKLNANHDELIRRRRTRLQVLGTAMLRPKLLASVVRDQRLFTSRFGQIGESAKGRGLVRSDLDCEAAALWLQATQFGHILTELNPALYDQDVWVQLTCQGVKTVFAPD